MEVDDTPILPGTPLDGGLAERLSENTPNNEVNAEEEPQASEPSNSVNERVYDFSLLGEMLKEHSEYPFTTRRTNNDFCSTRPR